MMTFREEYEQKYRLMRSGATIVEGELLLQLVKACQKNPWLKVGGIDFADDPTMESDYPYALERYDDPALLQMFFEHGNWSIRTAVQYQDLIFVNQVNGGDEWWTCKVVNGKLLPFESITFRAVIARGKFREFLERLHRATPEQCQALNY